MYAPTKLNEKTDWELVTIFGVWIVFEACILMACLFVL